MSSHLFISKFVPDLTSGNATKRPYVPWKVPSPSSWPMTPSRSWWTVTTFRSIDFPLATSLHARDMRNDLTCHNTTTTLDMTRKCVLGECHILGRKALYKGGFILGPFLIFPSRSTTPLSIGSARLPQGSKRNSEDSGQLWIAPPFLTPTVVVGKINKNL